MSPSSDRHGFRVPLDLKHIRPNPIRRPQWLLAAALLAACLAGCGPASDLSPSPSLPRPESPSPPAETHTPTPESAPLAILVAGSSEDPQVVGEVAEALSGLAARDGLEVRRQEALPNPVPAPARVVIVLGAQAELQDIAAAAPQTQFVAVGARGLEPDANLSLVGPSGPRPDIQAFIAGYLAAVITQDWRIGVILPGGGPADELIAQAYSNGAGFYCGLCSPYYPPYIRYPVTLSADAGGSGSLEHAAAELASAEVSTAYLPWAGGDHGNLQSFVGNGLLWIGDGPPPAGLESGWVASILPDPAAAVRELWPSLMSGAEGVSSPLPYALKFVNPDLLSPGRQEEVEDLVRDLLAGYVATGLEANLPALP